MSQSMRSRHLWIPVSGVAALLAAVSASQAEFLAYDAVATPTPQPQAQPLVTLAKLKQDSAVLTVKRTWWSAKKDQIEASLTVKIPNEPLKLTAAGDAKNRHDLLLEFRHADGAAFAECDLDVKQAKKKQAVFASKEIYRRGTLQIKSGVCDPDISTEVAEQTIPDVKPGDAVILKDATGSEILSATFMKTQ